MRADSRVDDLASTAAVTSRVLGYETGVFWLPTHHDMGLVGGVLVPVLAGATSVLGLDVRKPNLEEVFLSLTGEALRQEAHVREHAP